MTHEFIVILDGQMVGRVTSNTRRRLTFTYES
jgi:hypothetical protein